MTTPHVHDWRPSLLGDGVHWCAGCPALRNPDGTLRGLAWAAKETK